VRAADADIWNTDMRLTTTANSHFFFFLVEDQDVQSSSQVIFFVQSFKYNLIFTQFRIVIFKQVNLFCFTQYTELF